MALASLEHRLQELFSSPSLRQKPLYEAAQYALEGGKRLRPKIVLDTATTFGCPLPKAIDAAVAIELLHTYSLIHDDLPCMDNDDYRRGKPSVHKVYGEGVAVLVGDCLLTEAFHTLASSKKLTLKEKKELIQILGKRSGKEGMIAGQYLDITSANQKISLRDLYFLTLQKTAALLSVSFVFGAVVAHASLQDRKVLHNFGVRYGLAYQIADDLQDTDIGKTTLVSLLGKRWAQETIKNLKGQAKGKLSMLSRPAPLLLKLL